ncbi:hypothetical protein GH714_039238 [Hevea brasiliensis]|uniref:BURP domain-containing protein n=1 Tax=Hevea brasiliensis TaxID=3981 RepID=A0A6A6LV64_HEVBR|nr:hypothetical protein GH714_039238 [Hevea brasiliensis]
MSHAVPPQEVYLQSVLPTTPMPKALRDLLPSVQKSDTSDGIRNKRPIDTSFKDHAVTVQVGGIVIGVGHGASVDLKPPFITETSPFSYDYGASKDELRINRNATFIFLDKDLHPGTKINLYFARRATKTKFLPRQVANMITFSSNNCSQILHKFFIKRNSTKAEIMKKTIEECEKPALQGESKYCATSLEAMVDFSTTKLRKNIQVLVTQIDKDGTQPPEFQISQEVKKIGGKIVACHVQNYVTPYSTAMKRILPWLTWFHWLELMEPKSRLLLFATLIHQNESQVLSKFLRLSLGLFQFVTSYQQTTSSGLLSR